IHAGLQLLHFALQPQKFVVGRRIEMWAVFRCSGVRVFGGWRGWACRGGVVSTRYASLRRSRRLLAPRARLVYRDAGRGDDPHGVARAESKEAAFAELLRFEYHSLRPHVLPHLLQTVLEGEGFKLLDFHAANSAVSN